METQGQFNSYNAKEITVLTNFSEEAKAALNYAAAMAKENGARIKLFHAIKPQNLVSSYNQLTAVKDINGGEYKVKAHLDSACKALKDQGIVVESRYAIGNPKNEIAEYLATSKPDLVIFGKAQNMFGLRGPVSRYLNTSYSGQTLAIGKEEVLDVAAWVLN